MATTSPTHKGSNLERIRNLEHQVAELRTSLWWMVGGGEFAAWAQAKAMPLAARAEFEEARKHFDSRDFQLAATNRVEEWLKSSTVSTPDRIAAESR